MAMSPRLLRPIASGVHPEAADWRARVIANGGTVSGSTLQAVSRFCASISAAGIRDRFFRLNLFCGDDLNLNAALVPLYRGPTFGGTQYGNATDTNAGGLFVSGDYAENAGLSAALFSTKYLDTGLASSAMPAGVIDSGHLSAWHGPIASVGADPILIGADNGATDRKRLQIQLRTSVVGLDSGRWGKLTVVNPSTGKQGARASAFLLTQRTSATNLEWWENTSVAGTAATSTTGIAGITFPFFVFRLNSTGSAAGDGAAAALRHYSIGDDMTTDQVTAFYTALQTFNTSLGRTS